MLPITPNMTAVPEQYGALLQMRDEPKLADKFAAALLNLNDILMLYAGMDDSLSKQLRMWIAKCFVLCPDEATLEPDTCYEEAFSDNVQDQFFALQKLLRNNLKSNCPIIEEPLFDGEWLWEARDYHLYTQISPFPVSPYNPSQILHVNEHPFAKAVLKWARELSELIFCPFEEEFDVESVVDDIAQTTIHTSTLSCAGHAPDLLQQLQAHGFGMSAGASAHMQLLVYQQLAFNAAMHKGLEGQVDTMKAIADECEAGLPYFQAQCAAANAQAEKSAEEQSLIIEGKLEDLESRYQQKLNVFEADLNIVKQEQVATKSNLETNEALLLSIEEQLAERIAVQLASEDRHSQEQNESRQISSAKISSLQQQIAQEQQKTDQKQELVDSLNNEMQAVKREQAAQEQRFEAIKAQQQNHTNALQQSIATQKDIVLQEKARARNLEDRLEAALAAQEVQKQQYEQQQRQLRQMLEAEIARHAAQQQQATATHAAEIARVQQQNQQQLDQRLQEEKSSNLVQVNQLQAQINREQQQRTQVQAHANSLQNQLSHQQHVSLSNQRTVTALSNQIAQQAARVAHVERKARKSKKWYKKVF